MLFFHKPAASRGMRPPLSQFFYCPAGQKVFVNFFFYQCKILIVLGHYLSPKMPLNLTYEAFKNLLYIYICKFILRIIRKK